MCVKMFLSHSEHDRFEAELLQIALEDALRDWHVRVWGYMRDQSADERNVAASLPEAIKESAALVFLLSPATGPTQWMELAYADAFDVPTFILLHKTTFEKLRSSKRCAPPLVLSGQCTAAVDWRTVIPEIENCCENHPSSPVARRAQQ
jgi:hypothetical protein